jgi:hypothetical protein
VNRDGLYSYPTLKERWQLWAQLPNRRLWRAASTTVLSTRMIFLSWGRTCRDELNAEGMRVVAVAWRLVGVAERDFSTRDEKDLVLAGFIAFLDPPKPA